MEDARGGRVVEVDPVAVHVGPGGHVVLVGVLVGVEEAVHRLAGADRDVVPREWLSVAPIGPD